ncbi:NAD-dependent succinate-semialdehyde dehydrogenase [Enterobacter oligotrophicus]|nr:NAD-dependent succinate-semialdehyde dehydrogenase [Enterobacter oligotrophicus]
MTTQALQDNILFQNGYLVNGIWKTLDTTFDVLNPATGEVIAKVAKAGKAETEEAIAAATKAFPAWRAKTAKERSTILYRWYELIIENKRWLGRLMTTEQGKPLKEAEGEVEYAASFIQWFAAITPWNFPMAMLTRKLGPALAAGCTGVIKPANNTPLSAFALLTLAKQAGVPDGVLNAVAGNTSEISDAIMASHDVRKISFTGSTSVGKTLVRNAAETMKKVSMELGGNAPYIVFEDADIDAAVKGAIANKFRNAGQVCVSVNRFYIQETVYDKFVNQLADAVNALKVGNGLEEGVVVGPLIEPSAVNKVKEHVEDAVAKGATVLAGGKPHALGGNFWTPTVLGDCHEGMKLAEEETFGPVAACFRFTSEDEVIMRANNTPYGLAAYFYTQNLSRVFRVSQAIESGMIGINECAVSTELGPFGGVKESGLGREGSVLGLEEFLEVKTLHIGGL